MTNNDQEMYKDFFRMDPEVFEELFTLIEAKITKQNVVRFPIPAKTRLEICLRFLASGDATKSIGFLFRVAPNTVSKIVSEVCEAIWDVLSPVVFPALSEDMWKQKAIEFEALCNFPNCVGAIDGKHCTFMNPPNSGSSFFNYKGNSSIVLLGVADANAMFTMVDIGSEGRNSDEGVLINSLIGEGLINGSLRFPKPAPVEISGPSLPHVLIGDDAFGLTSYMMKPYPSSGLNLQKKVFNYRESRARRIVECAFGIFAERWQILKKPICATVENICNYIQSSVCLHNFIMSKELAKPRRDRKYSDLTVQQIRNIISQRRQSFTAILGNAAAVREAFMKYFSEVDKIPGQCERAAKNQF